MKFGKTFIIKSSIINQASALIQKLLFTNTFWKLEQWVSSDNLLSILKGPNFLERSLCGLKLSSSLAHSTLSTVKSSDKWRKIVQTTYKLLLLYAPPQKNLKIYIPYHIRSTIISFRISLIWRILISTFSIQFIFI